jgi:RNase P subunit RPR2
LDIIVERQRTKTAYVHISCPNCGITQRIAKPLDELFPYDTCQSCKRPFYVNNDLTIRKLTDDEKDDMPAEWVRILEDLSKKKLAIVFRLE